MSKIKGKAGLDFKVKSEGHIHETNVWQTATCLTEVI